MPINMPSVPVQSQDDDDADWLPWVLGGLALAGGATWGLGALGGLAATGAGEVAGTAALTAGAAPAAAAPVAAAGAAPAAAAAAPAAAAAAPTLSTAGQTALGAGEAVTAQQVAAMQTANMLTPAQAGAYTTAASGPVAEAQLSGGLAGFGATAQPATGMIARGFQAPPPRMTQKTQIASAPRPSRHVPSRRSAQQEAPQMPEEVLARMSTTEAQALGPGIYEDWMRRRKGGPMSMFSQRAYGGRAV